MGVLSVAKALVKDVINYGGEILQKLKICFLQDACTTNGQKLI
jgi:hypothetical protein